LAQSAWRGAGAQLGQRIGVREFLPTRATAAAAFGAVCVAKPWVCADAVGALCGYNPGNLSPARTPLRLAYMPAGALGARGQAKAVALGVSPGTLGRRKRSVFIKGLAWAHRPSRMRASAG
jgi:hypothetical protein